MQKNVTVLDKETAREHVMPEATFKILMSMPGSKDKYKLVSAPAPEPEAPPANARGKKTDSKTESEV